MPVRDGWWCCQHGRMWRAVLSYCNHGQWSAYLSRQSTASQEQVRRWLHARSKGRWWWHRCLRPRRKRWPAVSARWTSVPRLGAQGRAPRSSAVPHPTFSVGQFCSTVLHHGGRACPAVSGRLLYQSDDSGTSVYQLCSRSAGARWDGSVQMLSYRLLLSVLPVLYHPPVVACYYYCYYC